MVNIYHRYFCIKIINVGVKISRAKNYWLQIDNAIGKKYCYNQRRWGTIAENFLEKLRVDRDQVRLTRLTGFQLPNIAFTYTVHG